MRSHGLCPKLITLILSVLLRVSQRLRVLVVKAAPNPPRRHEDAKKHNPQPCAFDPAARSPPGSFNSTMPAAVGFIPARARSAAQKAVGRRQKAEGGTRKAERKLPTAYCLPPSAFRRFRFRFGRELWPAALVRAAGGCIPRTPPTAEAPSRSALSSRSDGWLRCRLRYRRGNIHGRAGTGSIAGHSGIFRWRQRPDGGLRRSSGRSR